jgi:hypothetical protein
MAAGESAAALADGSARGGGASSRGKDPSCPNEASAVAQGTSFAPLKAVGPWEARDVSPRIGRQTPSKTFRRRA